ncbi:type II secretion system F family protein [Altererythrobacter litoralis]|uniref:Type II secretion system F family protein n=1 Tax=Altererythrobacter litoralis TaxID=3113904 RepID=A0ABU7GGF8_9SPHN|nr:type II secretion system F family protein [Erythrobacteraceae bacterium 1XM1-14]
MTVELIRIVILLLIFAAVFILTQAVANSASRGRSHRRAINKRLKMISAGQDREDIIGKLMKNRPQGTPNLPDFVNNLTINLQRILFISGSSLTIAQASLLMTIGLVAVFLLAMLGLALTGFQISLGSILVCGAFSIGLAIAMPIMVYSNIAASRRKKMEHQFPIALDIFVRALRSGHPIAAAIDLLTQEMDDPIGSEFGLISDEVSYGAELIDGLENMAQRWDLDDMKMFVVSLSVQSQTGGNLADILDKISQVIRDRHQLYLKVRALSSEGRMTAWMLTVLPIFAFVMIFLMSPSFYLDNAEDPMFIYGFAILIAMYITGVFMIRRLVDLKV